jgi:hypothetical protein
MHRTWHGIVIALWFAFATISPAAQSSGTTAAAPPTEMEEIVVRAPRLYELRAAIVKAEDRFYARYNELNKVDDFDVECKVDAPTGTKFKQRGCLTRVQLKAQKEQGSEFLQMIQDKAAGAEGTPVRGAPPTTDPDTAMLARYPEYKMNVLYLLKMNPELRRLVRERDEAEKRYNDELKKRFKGRLGLSR